MESFLQERINATGSWNEKRADFFWLDAGTVRIVSELFFDATLLPPLNPSSLPDEIEGAKDCSARLGADEHHNTTGGEPTFRSYFFRLDPITLVLFPKTEKEDHGKPAHLERTNQEE